MDSNLFSFANLIITTCLALGGFFAFRYGFKRAASEVQERVINALETELNEIRTQLAEARRETTRLDRTLDTIIAAFTKAGIYITIQGDVITIENSKDGSVHVTRITEEH